MNNNNHVNDNPGDWPVTSESTSSPQPAIDQSTAPILFNNDGSDVQLRFESGSDGERRT